MAGHARLSIGEISVDGQVVGRAVELEMEFGPEEPPDPDKRCPGSGVEAVYGVGQDGKAKCLDCGRRIGVTRRSRHLRPHFPPEKKEK